MLRRLGRRLRLARIPKRDHIGPLKHLAKEAIEAQVRPADHVEIADCLFLRIRCGAALRHDAGYAHIKVAEQKLLVNKARKWQKPTEDNPVEHVREVASPVVETTKVDQAICRAAQIIDKKVLRYDTKEIEADPIGWLSGIIREQLAAQAPLPQPEKLAQKFHETYERLAPEFGYETRKASAKPWNEVPEQNRKLMIAVCAEILKVLADSSALSTKEKMEHGS